MWTYSRVERGPTGPLHPDPDPIHDCPTSSPPTLPSLLRMSGEGGLLDIGYGMDPLLVLGDELRDGMLDPDSVTLVQVGVGAGMGPEGCLLNLLQGCQRPPVYDMSPALPHSLSSL